MWIGARLQTNKKGHELHNAATAWYLTDREIKMKRVTLGLIVAVLCAQGLSAQHTQQGGKLAGTDTGVNASTTAVVAGGSITATSGTPQTTLINTAFSLPLQVTVTDGLGSPLSGIAVTFTAPASGPSASLSSAGSATTDAGGHASVTATANSVAGGPYLVSASAGFLTPANFSLTNEQEFEGAIPMLGGVGLLVLALLVSAAGVFTLWRTRAGG
jgi:hypothetical protein